MLSNNDVQFSDSKFAIGYMAILMLLVVVQPVIADSILFFAFIGMAIASCFLPFSLPSPIFLSLCVMLLFLIDVHSPFQSAFVYATSVLGGIILVGLRFFLSTLNNPAFEGGKAQFDAFWDTIVDGLVVINNKAIIVAANPAVEKLFGHKVEDLIGQNVKILMPHYYADEHDGYVSAYNKTGDAKIIGTGREVEGLREDGSQFPMYLAVSKFEQYGRRFYCGIVRDMTVENEIRESLLEAKNKAESASAAKTKFLRSISHEVRTPLNAILGFSQLLGTTVEGKVTDEQQDYMDHIQTSGEHLLALINEVLDMSQIESGRLQLSIERIDPTSVLEECINMVEAVARKYEVTLQYLVELPEGVAVVADRVRLKQALINLSTNALKYNRRGGTAHWRVMMPDANIMRFEITDTGLGISDLQKDSLFEPFNRLGREASTIEGTGIGLAVTKTVLEAMGGRLNYKSLEGVGSTFWMDLPASPVSLNTIADAHNQGDVPKDSGCQDEAGTVSILYIEDNPANTVLMQRFLAQLPGLNLLLASTAEVGLQMVQEQKIDLILMDLNLPGMDGFEAQTQLAQDDRTRNIPVVAVSADVSPSTIKRAMNVGFRKFISKPFNLKEARQTIESVLPEDRQMLH